MSVLGMAGIAGCNTGQSGTDTGTPTGTETETATIPETRTPTVGPTTDRLTETPSRAGTDYIRLHRWTDPRGFVAGELGGVGLRESDGALTITDPLGEREYTDPYGHGTKTWEYGRWVSPMRSPGFEAKQLVASWIAGTPKGTWIEVEMQGKTTEGDRTDWYVMGRWAETNADIHRTTVPDQGDEHGHVAIDTFKAATGVSINSYRLRVTLYRLPDTDRSPAIRSLSAMTSHVPEQRTVETSQPSDAAGTVLDVPQYSQNVHRGEYEKWGGGGEAWCSPTSTAMVVEYWGRGPTEKQMSWVNPDYQDPAVDFAARGTYDHSYGGTGNWPFNVAYAGRFGLDGFVTRLSSLRELGQYIGDGVPIITSLSFEEHELPNAGYGTDGHLLVVVGFTENGDVVANDPFAPTNEEVQVVYPREAFESVWQESTGGISYVIYPA